MGLFDLFKKEKDPWLVCNADENGQWIVVRISKEIPSEINIDEYPE